MITFKKGDNVKVYTDSIVVPVEYGVIVKVNKNTVKVRLSSGAERLVNPNNINFD